MGNGILIRSVRRLPGGVLGEQAEALSQIKAALEGLAPGTSIVFTREGVNSIRIHYGGSQSGECWSGRVWFNGELKWDFNNSGNAPDGERLYAGMYGNDNGSYVGSVSNEWLKISRATGEYVFADEVGEDTESFEYFHVALASRSVQGGFDPTHRVVCGDIRVESGGGTWSGRVLAHDGAVIFEVDIADPDAITGEWIAYDGMAGGSGCRFVNSPVATQFCWHVANPATPPATGYVLSPDTAGDIVLPVPKEWDERQALATDKDGKLAFRDLSIKSDDPGTGFQFVKEEGADELLQMKATGGAVDNVLKRTSDGAAWADYEGWPEDTKLTVITGLSGELAVEGTSLILRLTVQEHEIDFNAKTVTDKSSRTLDDISIAGSYCYR